jgi:hypothetical protein
LIAENKVLRAMAHVEDDLGEKLETIKLHDREKIEDYKRLISILQEDVLNLEKERAELKHKLREQSLMYST